MVSNDDAQSSSDLEFQNLEATIAGFAERLKCEVDPAVLFDHNAQIGNYTVRGLINFGGQAYVFNAFDNRLEREVVIKLYRHVIRSDRRQQALDEARCLVQIDSPRVAKCFDYQVYNNRPYVVMELIKGLTLFEYTQEQSLTTADSISIAIQIAQGVAEIHKKGILHLDLKPDNIIIPANRLIKIVDFGLSRFVSYANPEETIGSPAYMAPEVANKQHDRVNTQTDVFGVGAVLYFLATGQAPYVSSTKSEVIALAKECRFPDPKRINPSISNGLNRVICRCLEKSGTNRYGSIRELQTELENINRSRIRARKIMIGLVTVPLMVVLGILGFKTLQSNLNAKVGVSEIRQADSDHRLISTTHDSEWYPFRELSATGTTDLTREFDLEFARAEIVVDDAWVAVDPVEGVYHFPLGHQVRLTFKTDTRCCPVGYTFNCANKKELLQEIYRFEPGAGVSGWVENDSEFSSVFEPFESSEGVTEYIYLRALTKKWTAPDFGNTSQSSSFRRNIRGLKPVDKKAHYLEAELVIPFRILKK